MPVTARHTEGGQSRGAIVGAFGVARPVRLHRAGSDRFERLSVPLAAHREPGPLLPYSGAGAVHRPGCPGKPHHCLPRLGPAVHRSTPDPCPASPQGGPQRRACAALLPTPSRRRGGGLRADQHGAEPDLCLLYPVLHACQRRPSLSADPFLPQAVSPLLLLRLRSDHGAHEPACGDLPAIQPDLLPQRPRLPSPRVEPPGDRLPPG